MNEMENKKKKMIMPAADLRGNVPQITKNYDLETKLVKNINSGKPPAAAFDEE